MTGTQPTAASKAWPVRLGEIRLKRRIGPVKDRDHKAFIRFHADLMGIPSSPGAERGAAK